MKTKTITINYEDLRFESYDSGYEYQVLNYNGSTYCVLNINDEEVEYFTRSEIKSILFKNGYSKYDINVRLTLIDIELEFISNMIKYENDVCLVDDTSNFISMHDLLKLEKETDCPIDELEKEYSVVLFKVINK